VFELFKHLNFDFDLTAMRWL